MIEGDSTQAKLMAEGIRMKQLEMHTEALEFGMNQTHEVITQGREDQAATKEAMQRELKKHQETISQYGQRIHSIFNILFALPQFKLPLEFSP